MRYTAPSSNRKYADERSEAVVNAAPATIKRWDRLSFSSTLYLRPILDALLAPMPGLLHDELRLGLQEALVNAAKHGNQLDPQKVVSVRYAKANGYYWWIVSDQGKGFVRPLSCPCPAGDSYLLDAQKDGQKDSKKDAQKDIHMVSDCGRGLYILHQVFDQVCWSDDGKEVQLAKQIQPPFPWLVLSPAAFIRQIELWWRRWSVSSVHSL